MIKRILIILMVVLFTGVSIQAQGLKRVPNKKKDSTKAESVVKNEQPSGRQKAISKKPEISQPKDEFIDRDGDGINDKMIKSRPPAIKKQKPPKPKPETQKPRQVQPKPQKPKEQPKKDNETKKSKR